MTRGFVLFESFIEAIDQLPEDRQWPFFKAIVAYRLDGKEPEFLSPLERMAFTVMKSSLDASAERYKKAVDDGQKGGRPKKWIDREEAEEAFARLKSWAAVAAELDVNEDTLRKARRKWSEQKTRKTEKPKNPLVNVIDNVTVDVNENVNDNFHLYQQEKKNKKEKTDASPPPAPNGASAPLPMMPGWEFDRPDGRYRITEEGRAVKIGEPNKPK